MILIIKFILALIALFLSYGAWLSNKDFVFFSKTESFDELTLKERLKFRLSVYSGILGVIITDIILIYFIILPLKIA